jgi:N-acetylneuraminic acid mutarotase
MTNLNSLVMRKRRQNPGIGILIFLMLNVGWITNIQAQNGWEEMPPMPTSRAVFKTVLHDGKIYAIGGIKSVNPPYGIETEVYDTETGKWTVMASMENPCYGLSVEIINNKIYVIGGVYSLEQQYTVIQEYDIETDKWSTKCTMPEPRFDHISEVIDGKIYIAGGLTVDENGSHPGLTSARVYDPVNDQWDTIADLHHERVFGRSCVFNNKIYVFGGASAGGPSSVAHQSIEIYDPETDVWTISEDEIPVPFSGGMVQVY